MYVGPGLFQVAGDDCRSRLGHGRIRWVEIWDRALRGYIQAQGGARPGRLGSPRAAARRAQFVYSEHPCVAAHEFEQLRLDHVSWRSSLGRRC